MAQLPAQLAWRRAATRPPWRTERRLTAIARRVADIASFIGTCLIAVLYGAAYGAVGFYIALGIYATDAPGWAVVTWLLAWVAVGAVVLTVWTIRWTGIDVRRPQDRRRTVTPRRSTATHTPTRLHRSLEYR